MRAPASALARPQGWLAQWQAWRDRLLGSAAFRRRALAFAPARAIARRRAGALFDLVAGFVYSQTLLACVQLRLFDHVRDGPLTVQALAGRVDVPDIAMERLLDAAVALRLMERRRHALYGLGPLGAALIDNPALEAMIEHHAAFYADLRDPVALLRGAPGALAEYWPYAGDAAPDRLRADQVAPYSALMSTSQPLVADEILQAWPLRDHACLMDVGGGEGGFLLAAARQAPMLRLMLFDLPAVAQRAQQALAAQGLSRRACTFGGDFLQTPLPPGADVISLVRVVHDHDDASVRRLLAAVFAALPPGGVLLLAEPLGDTPGARSMGDAYFGLYLLAMGSGRPRTARELTSMLHDAGFVQVQQRRTRLPLQTGLLVARRPG
jgi:demethylspheroidene O-methyltransferase